MKYYKNANRYTAVKDSGTFIQVQHFNSTSRILFGKNELIVADCESDDVEITEQEFLLQLNPALAKVHDMLITDKWIKETDTQTFPS